VVEMMGYKSGTHEGNEIAGSHQKEERTRLTVIQLEILLDGGHQGGRDDPGDEIQEEDRGEKQDGTQVPAKGRKAFPR